MVRVSDVAKAAGVAYSTASVALRGVGRIAEPTRQRVLEAARELGYQVNAAASLLASQRKPVPRTQQQVAIAYLAKRQSGAAYRGIQAEAARLGLQVVMPEIETAPEPEQLSRTLYHRGVEGLIIDSRESWTGFDWGRFDFESFSLVKMGRGLPLVEAATVCMSISQMIRLALDRIFALGYRRVLCVLGPSASEDDDESRLGRIFTYRQRHLQPGTRLEWIELPDPRSREELRACIPWIVQTGFDALLLFPSGLIRALESEGLCIPRQCGAALVPMGSAFDAQGRRLAGIDARPELQGVRTVSLLHDLLRLRKRGLDPHFSQTHLHPEWRDGEILPGKA